MDVPFSYLTIIGIVSNNRNYYFVANHDAIVNSKCFNHLEKRTLEYKFANKQVSYMTKVVFSHFHNRMQILIHKIKSIKRILNINLQIT